MTKALATSPRYAKLRKAIEKTLIFGAARARLSLQAEAVKTMWQIGKALSTAMEPESHPGTGNAALITRLSRDLGRHNSFFYDAAKFHRLYPDKAPRQLSWSHYLLLIRVEDPQKRRALEQKALAEAISARDFRMFTRLPYGLTHPIPGVEPGSEAAKTVLAVERGSLYHYQTTQPPREGRVMIDLGFGIERDIRSSAGKACHAGLVLRAIRRQPTRHSEACCSLAKTRNRPKNLKRDPSLSTEFRMTTQDDQDSEQYDTRLALFDKTRLYTYAATLVRVIDGDTILARVDLGFRTWIVQTFRLRGIDAPERTCALGQKAKAEVSARLKPCACLVIKSYKQEKYGRYLADVFYQKEAGEDRERILKEGAFLNQELLDEELATLYTE